MYSEHSEVAGLLDKGPKGWRVGVIGGLIVIAEQQQRLLGLIRAGEFLNLAEDPAALPKLSTAAPRFSPRSLTRQPYHPALRNLLSE